MLYLHATDEYRLCVVTGTWHLLQSRNLQLPAQAAKQVARQCPGVKVLAFSDRDLGSKREEIEEALAGADVFFGSLLFDFDQVSLPPRPAQALWSYPAAAAANSLQQGIMPARLAQYPPRDWLTVCAGA